MAKRHSYDKVKEVFESAGYILLSDNYINSRQKLEFVCPNGHRDAITYSSFKDGHRCATCSGVKKPSYREVKRLFAKRGYKLLSTTYKNSRQKLKYVCPEGHRGTIAYGNFRNGQGCPVCADNHKRLSYVEVKRSFEERGYTLLSTNYVNNYTHLEYICPNGHNGSITYKHFKEGQVCPICNHDAQKLSYDEVKLAFEREGYTLLSTDYVNNSSKLDYICPKGHIGSIRYGGFQRGKRCSVCAGNKTLTLSQVKSFFAKEGYTLLSTFYVNNSQHLEYLCPNGHRGSITYANFYRGKRCPECAGNKRLTYEYVASVFSEQGYTLLSKEYVNNNTKLEYICPEGHRGAISYKHFVNGCRCRTCFGGVSKAELELRDYVISLVGEENVEANVRSVIPPLELDIFIPAKNLAIEYCGLYWHSEVAGGKPRDYHRAKMDVCADKGIRLITIFEDEFLNHPEVVKSRISNALGCIEERIYARKCHIKSIDVKTSAAFLREYHLQGNSNRTYGWGLFYGDRLLQVLTIGKVSRAHAAKVDGRRVNMYELKRFATIPNVVVVGGASRLFKTAVSFVRDEGGEYIKSYSDNRYANLFNSVYEKLGFELVAETKYTPHYILDDVRYRNQALRKTPEERLAGKTEWELRQEQGYDRIWDCGHRTYLYAVGGSDAC